MKERQQITLLMQQLTPDEAAIIVSDARYFLARITRVFDEMGFEKNNPGNSSPHDSCYSGETGVSAVCQPCGPARRRTSRDPSCRRFGGCNSLMVIL